MTTLPVPAPSAAPPSAIVLEMYEIVYDDRNEDIEFETFYENMADMLEMDLEEVKAKYNEALSVTKTGFVIVLKRTVRERWTNNYHPLWMLPWNANMDIQIGKFFIVE